MSGNTDYKKEYENLIKNNKEITSMRNYMQGLLNALADCIIIAGIYEDERYLIKDSNQAAYELLGYEEEELIGMDLRELIKEGLDEVFLMEGCHNETIKNMEKTYIGKYEKEIPVIFSVSQLENENQEIKEIVCVAQDLRLQKEKEKRLVKYAEIDKMTGAFNRAMGIKKLTDLIKKNKNDFKFGLSFVDINDLKIVNDEIGHSAGDELIIGVVQTIKKIIDDDDFVFRLGGDEFIIVFLNKSMQKIQENMNEVVKKLDEENLRKNQKMKYSISYGIKENNGQEKLTLDELIEEADKEMYKMKRKIKGKEDLIYKSKVRKR